MPHFYTELDPAYGKHPSFLPPQTGYRFAFTLVDDHLSSLPMHELSRNRTEAILDLNAVCWIRNLNVITPNTHRSHCLPIAFFVPTASFFYSHNTLFEWVKKNTTKDFKTSAGIDCTKLPCIFEQDQKTSTASIVLRIMLL